MLSAVTRYIVRAAARVISKRRVGAVLDQQRADMDLSPVGGAMQRSLSARSRQVDLFGGELLKENGRYIG